MMIRTLPTTTSILRNFLMITLLLAMALAGWPPAPANAAIASKEIVGSGTYVADDEPVIEVKFSKSVIPPTPLAEVVFVIDTSRSLDADIYQMKRSIRAFIDQQLRNYPGYVRVGITKIGNGTASWDSSNPPLGTIGDSRDAYVNRQMFVSGSTDALPNSQVGVDKVQTITSANVQALKDYVDTIAIEPRNNPQQPDGINSYTSDIGPGLGRGAGMFTSDKNAKFMVLMTDGIANKGLCPIKGDGKPQYSLPTGTHLQIIPGGTERSEYLESRAGAAGGLPSGYPSTHGELGVCGDFIRNFYSSSGLKGDPPGDLSISFLDKLRASYAAQGIDAVKSSTAADVETDTFIRIMESVKIDSITLKDTINGAVFSNATVFKGLFACQGGTRTRIQSTGYVPSGRSVTISVYRQNTANYDSFCAQFQGRVKSGVASGDYDVNTVSSSNRVEYYNKNGDLLYTDSIARGTITIGGEPAVSGANLQPANFVLTDADGVSKRVFPRNQQIFVQNEIRNVLKDTAASGSITRYYANEPGALGQNPGNPYALCMNNGTFSGGKTIEYGSYDGHYKQPLYINCNGKKSWSMSTPNDDTTSFYTARVYLNIMRSAGPTIETNYADNQATVKYVVYDPPTNLNQSAASCTDVNLTWQHGTTSSYLLRGYRIRFQNTATSTSQYKNVGVVTSTTLSAADGLNPGATYSWGIIPIIHVNGFGDVEGDEVPGGSNFTLPECLGFDLTGGDMIPVRPGDGAGNTSTVYINLLPSNSDWSSSDTVTTTIRDIKAGVSSCSDVSPSGAADNDKLGLTVTIDGSGGQKAFNKDKTTFSVKAVADSSVSPGAEYTICLGAVSNASPDQRMMAIPVQAVMDAWFQVAGEKDGAAGAGDVHSNGVIGSMILPKASITYFFRDPSQGIVSAASSIGSLDRLARNYNWQAGNLGHTIATPSWNEMLTSAENKGPVPSKSPAQIRQIVDSCNGGQNATIAVQTNGTLAISGSGDWNFACNGLNLVVYVNGNLQVQNNIIDASISGTLTFIVKNDITVNAAVDRADGVFMVGGTFDDSVGNNPLIMHGAVLGLTGATPGSATGRIKLSRDLGSAGNALNPAETFFFQPKYLYLLQDTAIGGSTYSWTE